MNSLNFMIQTIFFFSITLLYVNLNLHALIKFSTEFTDKNKRKITFIIWAIYNLKIIVSDSKFGKTILSGHKVNRTSVKRKELNKIISYSLGKIIKSNFKTSIRRKFLFVLEIKTAERQFEWRTFCSQRISK